MHENKLPSFVRLTKVSEAANADVPAGRPEDYRLGAINSCSSLPVAYVLEGWLLHPLKVGDEVIVLRVSRNGVTCPGVFRSTGVVSVGDKLFTTKNSCYVWSELA